MPEPDPRSFLILAGGSVSIPLALGLALILTLLYVGTTARKKGERRRRLDLALASLVGGPMIGALFASAHVARGQVNPLDVGYTYAQCAGMGLLVGMLVGLAFLITAALAPAEAGKPPADPEL